MEITPAPTDDEAAAIAAALQLVAFRPVVVVADDAVAVQPAWRFSGRWWSRPIASRRVRP